MRADVLTFSLIVAIAFMVQSIAIIFIHLTNKSFKGVQLWIIGTFCIGLGFLSIYFRQYESLNVISIIGSNILDLGGVILIYNGIMKFNNQKVNIKFQILVFSIFIIFVLYFTFINNSVNGRIINISFGTAIVSFMVAYTVIREIKKPTKTVLRIISIAYFITGIFTLFRAIAHLTFAKTENFFSPSLMQTITFFVVMFSGLALTYGLIIMVFQRLNSELAEAKNHFELIFNTIPDSIMVTNTENGEIINVNEGFTTLTGHSKEEGINNSTLNLNMWSNPDDRKSVITVLSEKGQVINKEFIFKNKAGNDIPVLFSAKIINSNGKPYILSITRDISNLKIIELELKLKNYKLEESNAEKDKFFSIIAHDLKGPFNSFLGLTEVMAEGVEYMGADVVKKMAENMNTSARNIYILLENLLEWSRMKRNQFIYSPVNLNVLKEINSAVETSLDSAKAKSITIETSAPDNLEVFADSYMLQSIIRNLVSNAIKFTYKRGTVSVSASKTKSGDVLFSVQDNGIGMDKATIENLFRIDAKVGRTGTEGELSTGIGLLLCKEFINKHNGKIWAESKEGNGSVFYFSIPANS